MIVFPVVLSPLLKQTTLFLGQCTVGMFSENPFVFQAKCLQVQLSEYQSHSTNFLYVLRCRFY